MCRKIVNIFKSSPLRFTSTLILLWLCLTSPILGFGQEQLPEQEQNLREYTNNKDLSNLHIVDIKQDKFGFIWIATTRGLNRYDGYSYTHFLSQRQKQNAYKDNMLQKLYFNEKGILSTISINSNISSYNFDREKTINYDPLIGHKVTKIVQGIADSIIWVAHNKGLSYYYEGDPTIHSVANKDIPTKISSISIDTKRRLWIASLNSNFVKAYDTQRKEIIESSTLPAVKANSMFSSEDEHFIYFVSDSGASVLNVDDDTLSTLDLDIEGRSIVYSNYSCKKLFVLTEDLTLTIYNCEDQTISRTTIDCVATPGQITTIFIDNNNNIWVGTFDDGCKLIPYYDQLFKANRALGEALSGHFVTSMTSDKGSRFWIGTLFDGVLQYDTQRNQLSTLYQEETHKHNLAIKSTLLDSQGRLWFSTPSGVYCYDTSTPTPTLLHKYLEFNNTRYITEDLGGNIWLVSSDEYLRMLPVGGDKFEVRFRNIGNNNNITFLSELRSGEYAFSLFDNSIFIGRLDGSTERIQFSDEAGNIFLRSVIYIYETSDEILWLGSYGCGLMRYDRSNNSYKIFDMNDGLSSNDVLAINEDHSGNIWMSTSYGLSKLYPSGEIENFFTHNTLFGNQYHERSTYTLDNIMYYSGNHGITSFIPETMKQDKATPVIIEDISTDSRSIKLHNNNIDTAHEEVELSYRENRFSISYVGIDYTSATNIQYQYILEGYDSNWSIPTTSRSVSYSHMPSGNYTFKVRASCGDGKWDMLPAQLSLSVETAPWLTAWAIICYVLLLTGLIYFIIRMYIRHSLNEERVQLAEQSLEKEKELNNTKISFFENISHELRTPLSLIYGPYSEIVSKKLFAAGSETYASIMGENIDRLMSLIDQLLDFAKLDDYSLPLAVQRVDIIALVEQINSRFCMSYNAKDIRVEISKGDFTHFEMLADSDKIDKTMSNLLSNACKYTPSGGNINIDIKTLTPAEVTSSYNCINPSSFEADFIQISVTNCGVCIPEQELDRVFDRFYRVNQSSAVKGTGIGLSFVKALITKHKGYIKAEHNGDTGMIFKFCLPLQKTIYSDEEIKAEDENATANDITATTPIEIETNESDSEERVKILIVDDEYQIQQFLLTLLSPKYDIIQAYRGEEGIAIAQSEAPHLIISDVMMPEMSGIEMCRRLKENIETSHIPIIMLSAKGEMSTQIEGINSSADAYIVKPFNPEYLLAVLRRIIISRRTIQDLFLRKGSTIEGDKQVQSQLNHRDRLFLTQVEAIVEANLSDTTYTVDKLVMDLHLSQSTFYRKIKSLMGLAPTDYLRTYRIKRAAELIESGNYRLSEISDMVGFSTHSHFSATFKSHFGMTPSQYKKEA